MARTFTIPFSGNSEILLQNAKKMAERNGANLTGNISRGHFSGQGIEGQYHVHSNTIQITITKKPLLIPDAMIESQLREFFKE